MIRLLLVEDDNNMRYIIQSGLQDLIGGYEVHCAENGMEGYKAWDELRPDITPSGCNSHQILSGNLRMEILT